MINLYLCLKRNDGQLPSAERKHGMKHGICHCLGESFRRDPLTRLYTVYSVGIPVIKRGALRVKET